MNRTSVRVCEKFSERSNQSPRRTRVRISRNGRSIHPYNPTCNWGASCVESKHKKISNRPGHDHWGGAAPPQPWARGGDTYDWRASVPTLFVFVLTTTYSVLHQDLTPGLAPSQHLCMQPHLTPNSSPPTHPISISILAINCLSQVCPWASPQQPLRIERPSTYTHALGKYTQEPWLYPPPPLTTERSSVGRVQAPHRLASRWCPFSIHFSNCLGYFPNGLDYIV